VNPSALVAAASLLLLGLAACADPVLVPLEVEEFTLDDIDIPNGFDFATSRDVTVQATLPPSTDPLPAPRRLHVGTRDGNGGFDLMFEGFVGADGLFTAVIPLASWKSELTLQIQDASGIRVADVAVQGASASYPEDVLRETWTSGSLAPSRVSLTSTDLPDGPQRVPEDLSGFPIAYTSYYPSQSTYGTIAFEDNWPWKGDYDFNDLVLSYHVIMYRSPSFDVVAMEFFFKIEAVGAEYRNGFGLSLPVSRRKITTAYGNLSSRSDADGLEAGQDEAVFILFDTPADAASADPTLMNTLPGQSLVDNPEVRFVVQFLTPLKDEDLGTPPFDPFLFVNGDRGREIHLIGKSPTAFADPQQLGTADDTGGYATERGLPWAIILPDAWPWPAERTPVNEAHLEFVPWAESGGTEYTDWYLSKGGNRDPGKLILR
jgi:LruC domain-containing protein